MKVSEAMTSKVEVVDADSPIQQAAARMKDLDIDALPVVEEGRVTGILTERDIVMRFVAEGLDYSGTTASDVMTREVVSCGEDDDLVWALRLMRRRGIRHLVVLGARGRLAGILSERDATGARAEEERHETQPRGQGPAQYPGAG